jgi:outer membrane protein assembly factor BamB
MIERRIRSRFSFFLLLVGAFLGACGSPSTPKDAHAPVTLPVATDPGSAALATKSNCTEPTTLTPVAERDKGIDAFLLDRPREAVDLLSTAVRNDPRDRAAEAFRAASVAKLEEAKAHATDDASSLRRIMLEPIPLSQLARKSIDGIAQLPKVRLEKQSETKNLITDDADWETKNQLTRVGRRGHDQIPATVAPKLGRERLQNTFVHPDHVAAIYDSTVIISAEGKRPLGFDARGAMRGPRPFQVTFAQLVGKALVVELAYNGYAKDSGGKNGYVAAFDASNGQLLWATDPLVANAGEAVISGGSMIVGYGFTAEPDFLFVLDLASGKVEQKIPLKSGPSAIRAKDTRIFVRAYDVDYVFKSTTGIAPALAASMNVEQGDAQPPAPPSPEIRCWVRRATAAIVAKDARGIHEAAERLAPISRDRILDELLRIEEKKLEIPGRLDLAAAPLIVVPAPPWQAQTSPGVTSGIVGAQKAPKLVKIASRQASPIRNMHPAFDPTRPWFIAPVDKGKVPEAARADIPSSFGQENLSAIIPDERRSVAPERLLLVYAGRFLALVKGDTTERVFDLEAFRHPPKANPQWKEFATQELTYAQERDGVLYLCNGGGSYAKEVFGKKGFMSALDATTGKLLWRSAPLMCNSTFAITGDHIVTGYGFTAEPDFIFLMRRSDGGVVQKIPVDTGPDTIAIDGNRVHVETYGNVFDFELR